MPIILDIASNLYHKKLFSGDLPRSVFKKILVQDWHHMHKTAECWGILARNIHPRYKHICEIRRDKDLENAERIVSEYFPTFSCVEEDLAEGCVGEYIEHLHFLSEQKPVFLLTGLMPCYLLYERVFELNRSKQLFDNPYKNWVEQEYKELSEGSSVTKLSTALDDLAEDANGEEVQLMGSIFTLSLKLEQLFFMKAIEVDTLPALPLISSAQEASKPLAEGDFARGLEKTRLESGDSIFERL